MSSQSMHNCFLLLIILLKGFVNYLHYLKFRKDLRVVIPLDYVSQFEYWYSLFLTTIGT